MVGEKQVSKEDEKEEEEEEEEEAGHRESYQSRNPLGKFQNWSRVKQEGSWLIVRVEEETVDSISKLHLSEAHTEESESPTGNRILSRRDKLSRLLISYVW